MNSSRRVLVFVVSCVTIYIGISLATTFFNLRWHPLNRMNLLSDLLNPMADEKAKKDTSIVPLPPPEKIAGRNFNLYNRAKFITSFNADTLKPAMTAFSQKLNDLKQKKRRRLRIAYFGDSMIEGDLLTQTLRELLQKEFGGRGVGFVPVTSLVSGFRQTVTANYSTGWQDQNFKENSKGNYFFSGHIFRGKSDWVEMTDRTTRDTAIRLEKDLFCGIADQPVTIMVNGKPLTINAPRKFNSILLNNDDARHIRVSVQDETLPVYGISFASESGVIVDNFSFRGISGIELNRLDTSFLNAINNSDLQYDMFIFQYGVNVLYRPADNNFNWYAKTFLPVIKKFKKAFPSADFMIISTADRAFRYDGEYQSATGIDSLIKTQALMAYETGCSFYNQYETMGGHNSIVNWATQQPALANKDYVHPNFRGAAVLATYFYQAIMKDYEKYLQTIK